MGRVVMSRARMSGAGLSPAPPSRSSITFGGGANALVGAGAAMLEERASPGAASIIASSVGACGARESAR